MLMAVPLVLGYCCGRIARGMRHVKPGWRNRLLWFSSADANETVLVGFAVLVMASALTLTMSRSGILGLLAALVISGWFVARRQAAGSSRVIGVGYLIVIAVVAVWWTGFDRLAARFAESGPVDASGRLGIWTDTWRLAGRFPIVGIGLNSYGTATLFYQTVNPTLHFTAAHNDYLQILADGGALVAVPAALVIVALIRAVRRQFRAVSHERSEYWIRIGAVMGILAVALQEAADFSLQIPGNAVLFVVLLALAARRSSNGEKAGRLFKKAQPATTEDVPATRLGT
jgi:O-antigen ligase